MESKFYGRKNHDTREWSDEPLLVGVGSHKVASITIWSDKVVGGIQCTYQTENEMINGEEHIGTQSTKFKSSTLHLEKDEYIASIEGRFSSGIDFITCKTSKGKSISGGGSSGAIPFMIEIPKGHQISSFFGGINGHLHFIGAKFAILPSLEVGANIKRSITVGKIHMDTKYFDDYIPELLKGRLSKVIIYHDNKACYGIESRFIADKKRLRTGLHVALKVLLKGKLKKATLKLDNDEYIVEVSGRNGIWFDKILLKTNKNKSLEIGGSGGNPFGNLIPSGKKLLCFGGGYGEQIHNLYAYYVQQSYFRILNFG